MKKNFFIFIAILFIFVFSFFLVFDDINAVLNSDGKYKTVEATVCEIDKDDDSDYKVYVNYKIDGKTYKNQYDYTTKYNEYKIGQKINITVSSKYPDSEIKDVLNLYENALILINVLLVLLSLIDSNNKVEELIKEFDYEEIIKRLRKKKIISICCSALLMIISLILNLSNERIIRLLYLDSYYEILNKEYQDLTVIFLILTSLVLSLKVYQLYNLRDNNLITIRTVCKDKNISKYEDFEGDVIKKYYVLLSKNNTELEISNKFYDNIKTNDKIGVILYKNKKFAYICKFENGYAENIDFFEGKQNDLIKVDKESMADEYIYRSASILNILCALIAAIGFIVYIATSNIINFIIFLCVCFAIKIASVFILKARKQAITDGKFVIEKNGKLYQAFLINNAGKKSFNLMNYPVNKTDFTGELKNKIKKKEKSITNIYTETKSEKFEKPNNLVTPKKIYLDYGYDEQIEKIRSKIKKKSKISTAGFSVFFLLPELFIVMIAFINSVGIIFGALFLLIIAALILLIIGKQKLSEDEKEMFELSFFEKLSSEDKHSIYNKGIKAFIYKTLSLVLNYSIIFMIVAMAEVCENAGIIIFLLILVVFICSVVFFIMHCRIINNKLFDVYTYKKAKKRENN